MYCVTQDFDSEEDDDDEEESPYAMSVVYCDAPGGSGTGMGGMGDGSGVRLWSNCGNYVIVYCASL